MEFCRAAEGFKCSLYSDVTGGSWWLHAGGWQCVETDRTELWLKWINGERLFLKHLMSPYCSYLAAWRAGLKMRNYNRFSMTFRLNAASSIKVNPQPLYLSRKTWGLGLFLRPLDQSSSQLSEGGCGCRVLQCCVATGAFRLESSTVLLVCSMCMLARTPCIVRAKNLKGLFPVAQVFVSSLIPLPSL